MPTHKNLYVRDEIRAKERRWVLKYMKSIILGLELDISRGELEGADKEIITQVKREQKTIKRLYKHIKDCEHYKGRSN